VFHFGTIALNGYVHELQWAFLPGLPLVMRWGGATLRTLGLTHGNGDGWVEALHMGALGAFVCGILASRTLYWLSVYHLRSPRIALLAALLSCLPSSPATLLYAPYNEPYFAFFSYKGMLECTRKRYLYATMWFSLAAGFRSNGVLLAGYLLWDLVAKPVLIQRRMPSPRSTIKAVILAPLVFAPFIAHQYLAYQSFCKLTTESRPWCAHMIPSVYTFVQAKYWNSGFLKYWTPSQAPNIIIALPVLTLILSFCGTHLRHATLPLILDRHADSSPFLHTSMTPHVIHSAVFALVLLFASHTQIALRTLSGVPVTYWAGAWLLLERPVAGRIWVGWSVVWGVLSVVLWTGFLPPA